MEYIQQILKVWEACLSQEKYYFEQAKALKDDPNKQPEFQALWLKADKLHRDVVVCNEIIITMDRLSHDKEWEKMEKHDFYELPSTKHKEDSS